MRTHTARKGVRRSTGAMVLSIATLALSACGGPSNGTQPTDGSAPIAATSTSHEVDGLPLADVKPCETITRKQADKLGLTTAGTINEFNDAACDWEMGEHVFAVAVYTDIALNEINFSGDEKKPTTLQGHDALLVISNKRQCSLAFAVTDNTSVVVGSTVDVAAPPGKACEIVKKAAPMVASNIFDN